jgi:hypothetical protein
MKYAIVHNGLVNNIVVAESKEVLEEFIQTIWLLKFLKKKI